MPNSISIYYIIKNNTSQKEGAMKLDNSLGIKIQCLES